MKKIFLALFCLCCIGAIQAQTTGTWLIQGGVTQISPDVTSGNLSAPFPQSTQVNMGSDTQASALLTYMFDRNWAIAVPLSAGFKHTIYGAGAISGVGPIGTVSALPIGAFGQYHFGEVEDKIRPYAMLGLSYVYFHDAKGSATLNAINSVNPAGGSTGLKVDSQWALSPGLGMLVKLDEKWFLNLSWARAYLKTTTILSTGQTIDTTLNPSVTTLGIGVRF